MRQVAGLDWRFALLLAVCFVLAAMAVTHSRSSSTKGERPRVQAQEKTESALKGEKPPEGAGQTAGDRPPRAGQIVPGAPGGEGKDQAKQGNDEGAEYWPSILGVRIKITDSLIILLTAALAIYTRELNRSTIKLWEAGERQAKIARESADAAIQSAKTAGEGIVAANRAWVQVKIEFPQRCKLVILGDRLHCNVVIKLKNVGNAPAMFVRPQYWLFVNTGGESYFDWRDRECEQLRAMDIRKGEALLPGDTDPADNAPQATYGASIPLRWVEEGLAFGRSVGQEGFPLWVVGCVNYAVPGSPRFHQTRFSYYFMGSRASFIGLDEVQDSDPLSPKRLALQRDTMRGEIYD